MENVFRIYPHLQRLLSLPKEACTVFAATCCERLLPNYRAFSLIENWGDPQVLENALEFVWTTVLSAKLDKEYSATLIRACEEVAPDSEDFDSLFTGNAIDAAGAIYYALHSLQDQNPEHAINAGRTALRSVEDYLFGVNAPDFLPRVSDPKVHQWLDQAPLMKAEIYIQEITISELESKGVPLDKTTIDNLRRTSAGTGIQPFLRGLVK